MLLQMDRREFLRHTGVGAIVIGSLSYRELIRQEGDDFTEIDSLVRSTLESPFGTEEDNGRTLHRPRIMGFFQANLPGVPPELDPISAIIVDENDTVLGVATNVNCLLTEGGLQSQLGDRITTKAPLLDVNIFGRRITVDTDVYYWPYEDRIQRMTGEVVEQSVSLTGEGDEAISVPLFLMRSAVVREASLSCPTIPEQIAVKIRGIDINIPVEEYLERLGGFVESTVASLQQFAEEARP